jgi:hypothetical protein
MMMLDRRVLLGSDDALQFAEVAGGFGVLTTIQLVV